MSTKFVVILDDEDAALLTGLQRILGALKSEAGEEPAAEEAPRRGRRARAEEPAEEAEVPLTTRRRRAGADTGSSTTAPASDAGASAGPRRSRRSEPAEAPAEETPRRRRRTEEPEDKGISDADLTKAASQAGQKISPKVVMQIIKEDYGVETVNEIPKDKRQEFLDTLKYEMEG